MFKSIYNLFTNNKQNHQDPQQGVKDEQLNIVKVEQHTRSQFIRELIPQHCQYSLSVYRLNKNYEDLVEKCCHLFIFAFIHYNNQGENKKRKLQIFNEAYQSYKKSNNQVYLNELDSILKKFQEIPEEEIEEFLNKETYKMKNKYYLFSLLNTDQFLKNGFDDLDSKLVEDQIDKLIGHFEQQFKIKVLHYNNSKEKYKLEIGQKIDFILFSDQDIPEMATISFLDNQYYKFIETNNQQHNNNQDQIYVPNLQTAKCVCILYELRDYLNSNTELTIDNYQFQYKRISIKTLLDSYFFEIVQQIIAKGQIQLIVENDVCKPLDNTQLSILLQSIKNSNIFQQKFQTQRLDYSKIHQIPKYYFINQSKQDQGFIIKCIIKIGYNQQYGDPIRMQINEQQNIYDEIQNERCLIEIKTQPRLPKSCTICRVSPVHVFLPDHYYCKTCFSLLCIKQV